MVLWPNQKLTASTYYTPPVCEAFNLAKAVFIGRVVNASEYTIRVYWSDKESKTSEEEKLKLTGDVTDLKIVLQR
jgi:hypothetical protein